MASFLKLFNSLFARWLSGRFGYLTPQSALLRRIVDRIRNSLELKVVLQTSVDEVAALLKLDRCIFFWYFKDVQQVQVVCERLGDRDSSLLGHYALTELGSAASLISKGALSINTGNLPKFCAFEWILTKLRCCHQSSLPYPTLWDSKASVLVPVRGRERSIGFIACLVDQPRRWQMAEVDFLQVLAQRLEIAVRQAQLYEKMQRQAQREKLVNQITTQTRQSLDLETILTQAIAHLLKAMEVDRCLVHLVETTSDDYGNFPEPCQPNRHTVENHQYGWRRNHIFEVCRPPFPASLDQFDANGPIAQWVICHRQQVVIPDITQDPRIGSHNPEYQQAQIKSSLVVPVKANGTLQAILYLNQCSYIRYWSRDDQKLAQAVADQLAISIKQAHLYAQSKQQAAESAEQARELAEALKHLQHIQAQLIQSEKMSSLGQMVAGIAHEINNPVSFIYGNLPHIEQYVNDLLRLLNAYQTHYPNVPTELNDLVREVDLDFLVSDFPRILNSMKSGSIRIREIILSLRSFSRLDEAHCKLADINEGLDSTLFVLQSHVKSDTQIIRHYGKLPKVECYPRQMNQVFMNLLMNAIDAVNQSHATQKSITLTTEGIFDNVTSEAWVRVTIADSGSGIPHDIQPRVFDPFFTTKEAGQGAGLGLTVSYQTIVNQHQGLLSFRSIPNQGTEFVVEIPVKRPDMRTRHHNLYFLSRLNHSGNTKGAEVAIANREVS